VVVVISYRDCVYSNGSTKEKALGLDKIHLNKKKLKNSLMTCVFGGVVKVGFVSH